jgi:hypothetical protein
MPFKLTAELLNVSRPVHERLQAGLVYADRLVQLAGSPCKAYDLRQEWLNAHRPPTHDWLIFNHMAKIDALRHMSPSEQRNGSFVVKLYERKYNLSR